MATTPDQVSRLLEPDELITLYELDLTVKNADPPIWYFHDGISPVGNNQITFKGHQYVAFPIRAEGFEWSTRGTLPRPKLTVSNINSFVSSQLRLYDDFVGCTIVQRRTFARYLAAPQGSEYNNPQEFLPQIFVVDRKVAETNTIVSFDLATGMDAEGIALPRRQILATACPFVYRGTECAYPAPVAGGAGWPVMNRLGAIFPGVFRDGVVDSADLTLLNSATAQFHTTPTALNDKGKLINGSYFVEGTKVAAVNSVSQVKLTLPAKASGSSLVFNINRTTGRFVDDTTRLPEPYNKNINYHLNDAVYNLVNGIRVYYVSRRDNNQGQSLTNEVWWYADVCLKKLVDCEYHFGAKEILPYGGWPGANKLA